MINLCETCATKLTNRYDKANCPTKLRKYGVDRLIGFRCTLTFEDMLDTTATTGEWAVAIADGDIVLSPKDGKLEIGESNSENFETGCGKLIPFGTSSSWTYTTPSTEDDYSDEDWWKAFHEDFYGWRWGWINCDGRLVLDDASITAIKAALAANPVDEAAVDYPGFDFSLQTIPMFEAVNGFGKPGQWKATGSFQYDNVIRSVEIPGLIELLNDEL